MNPVKGSNNKDTCSGVTSSNCVIWNGPDLACIDLCKGDTISDVVAKTAEKLCDYIKDNDLSDLDLACIFNVCNGCSEPEKTLKTVLQLLINKVCSFQDIVDKCCGGSTTSVSASVFEVNLRCLAITDGSGNILNDGSNDAIIQSIIDRVCQHDTAIAALSAQVSTLQTAVNNIPPPASQPQPVPSACLFTGTKAVDAAFPYLDAAVCGLKTLVGPDTSVAKALSLQCEDLPSILGLNPNIIVSPTSLADTVNNMWLVICNLAGRVKNMENSCCKPSCDDIKIGFSIVLNTDDTINLKFTNGAGTNIPIGFTDCGSFVTITDQHGKETIVDNIGVANSAITPDIDITEMTKGDLLAIALTAKLCYTDSTYGTITCEKCVVKTLLYPADGVLAKCSICRICATTGTGTITINYNANVGGHMVIDPAECFDVDNYGPDGKPAVATITQTGSVAIDNLDCLDVPEN